MDIKKVKLGELCKIVKGKTGIKKAISGQYPMVVTAEERISHNEYQFDNKAVIVPLVSSTGHGHASIKRLHYQEGRFALGSILAAIIVTDESILNPYFLYIYLSYFKDQLLVPLMKGSANVSLNINKIQSVEIYLPTLKEQLKIIELEKNNVKVKEFENETQTQKQLVSQLKQAILQEAIEGKLTEEWRKENPIVEPASKLLERIKAEKAQLVKEKKIKKEKPLPPITPEEIPFELPEGWVWCRMKDAGLFERGKSKHRPRNDEILFKGGNIPFVQTGDVARSKNTNYLIDTCSNYYNEVGLAQSRIWPKGTLCITIAANIAQTGFLNIEACFPDSVVGFSSLSSPEISKYVRYFIDATKVEIEKFAPATAQKNINLGILYELKFPIPPEDEIEEIVRKVEALLSQSRYLESEITQCENHAQILMQAVLKEAFEGRKEVEV